MYVYVALAMPTDTNMHPSWEGEEIVFVLFVIMTYCVFRYLCMCRVCVYDIVYVCVCACMNTAYEGGRIMYAFVSICVCVCVHVASAHMVLQVQDHLSCLLAQPSWRRQKGNRGDHELLPVERGSHVRQDKDLYQNTSYRLLLGRATYWKPSHCSKYMLSCLTTYCTCIYLDVHTCTD